MMLNLFPQFKKYIYSNTIIIRFFENKSSDSDKNNFPNKFMASVNNFFHVFQICLFKAKLTKRNIENWFQICLFNAQLPKRNIENWLLLIYGGC